MHVGCGVQEDEWLHQGTSSMCSVCADLPASGRCLHCTVLQCSGVLCLWPGAHMAEHVEWSVLTAVGCVVSVVLLIIDV